MKVFIKVPTVVQIGPRIESLGPGQILDIPDAEAKELVRAGYAEEPGEEYETAVHPVARRRRG